MCFFPFRLPGKKYLEPYYPVYVMTSSLRPVFLALVLALTACATTKPAAVVTENSTLVLKPASFADLPGWSNDRQSETLDAFRKSCSRIEKKTAEAAIGFFPQAGTYGDWQPACLAANAVDDTQARGFFETWFRPYQAMAPNGADEGLFTGYYEASLRGSRTQHGPYQHPLRSRPGDLVTVDLGDFRGGLKGQRIAGRVVEGALKPYSDHRAIVQGRLMPGEDRPLIWIDNPIDVFFLQIQGSGIVALDDGTAMRVGYAAQNGWSYYAVGRELVKRGELPKDQVTMQSIRDWLTAHPDQASDIMFANPSYVFFKELTGDGPLGGEGVPLSPGRSLAVDHGKIPYGVPVWIDAEPPEKGLPLLRRLMMAQDTGGAIRGPVRGDVFWGHGPDAERMAGPMKSKGRMWLLLPKNVRP